MAGLPRRILNILHSFSLLLFILFSLRYTSPFLLENAPAYSVTRAWLLTKLFFRYHVVVEVLHYDIDRQLDFCPN